MTDLKLNEEEKQRLEKIAQAIGWGNMASVLTERFNSAAADNRPFLATYKAFTKKEGKEQTRYIEESIRKHLDSTLFSVNGKDAKSALSALKSAEFDLKSADIFMRAARRAGEGAELAALLPINKLDKKDAAVLEKLKLSSLAAAVRAKP